MAPRWPHIAPKCPLYGTRHITLVQDVWHHAPQASKTNVRRDQNRSKWPWSLFITPRRLQAFSHI
eukprot:8796470-Pyramimonas_sp.AAC.1